MSVVRPEARAQHPPERAALDHVMGACLLWAVPVGSFVLAILHGR